MGLWDRLTGATALAADLEAASRGRDVIQTRVGIRSPWSADTLAAIPWREWFAGDANLPVNRADAMTIPAVVRSVGQVTAALASCPWVKYLGADPAPNQPRWLWATDHPPMSPYYRTAMIVEDLILGGWCVLDIERDGRNAVTSVERRDPDTWTFGEGGTVDDEDGHTIPWSDIVLVKGPTDGLLNTGKVTLRGALSLEQAWTKAVRNPTPTQVLHGVDDIEPEDEEIDVLLTDWRTARQDPDGMVAYLPQRVNLETPDTRYDANLLIAARNAVAVDVARLIGLPSASLDAGAVQTSLTYTNTSVGVGFQLVSQGFKPYADCLGAALSLDNVTDQGTRVALDMAQLFADAATLSPSGTPTQD